MVPLKCHVLNVRLGNFDSALRSNMFVFQTVQGHSKPCMLALLAKFLPWMKPWRGRSHGALRLARRRLGTWWCLPYIIKEQCWVEAAATRSCPWEFFVSAVQICSSLEVKLSTPRFCSDAIAVWVYGLQDPAMFANDLMLTLQTFPLQWSWVTFEYNWIMSWSVTMLKMIDPNPILFQLCILSRLDRLNMTKWSSPNVHRGHPWPSLAIPGHPWPSLASEAASVWWEQRHCHLAWLQRRQLLLSKCLPNFKSFWMTGYTDTW